METDAKRRSMLFFFLLRFFFPFFCSSIKEKKEKEKVKDNDVDKNDNGDDTTTIPIKEKKGRKIARAPCRSGKIPHAIFGRKVRYDGKALTKVYRFSDPFM